MSKSAFERIKKGLLSALNYINGDTPQTILPVTVCEKSCDKCKCVMTDGKRCLHITHTGDKDNTITYKYLCSDCNSHVKGVSERFWSCDEECEDDKK